MAASSVLQVRLDAQTKSKAEELYRSMGWTLSGAVRCFISQSLSVQGMPFMPETSGKGRGKAFGILSEFADQEKQVLEHDVWIDELSEGARAYVSTRRRNEMDLKKRAIKIEEKFEQPRWREDVIMGHPGAHAPMSRQTKAKRHDARGGKDGREGDDAI